MGNSFGTLFRVTTWGESHGAAVVEVVVGCPPRLALDHALLQAEPARRRPGQGRMVAPRISAVHWVIVTDVDAG